MTQKNDQLVRDNNIEMMHKQGHTKATAVTQCGFLNEKEKEFGCLSRWFDNRAMQEGSTWNF